MRSFSAWSAAHPAAARWMIALCHLLLTAITLTLAGYLRHLPVLIPPSLFLMAAMAAIVAIFLIHQYKKRWGRRTVSARSFALVRLKYGLALFTSYILVLGWFYNDLHIAAYSPSALHGSYSPPVSRSAMEGYAKQEKAALKAPWKRLSLKEFRQELRNTKMMQKSGGGSTGQTFAIIGIILLALTLAYVVLAAACSLSCSGFGTGAIFVGVVGLAGIIWGTTVWIRHVNRTARKKREAAGSSQSQFLQGRNTNSMAIE